MVASAPGTVGNDPYADSDRGGTDTPLDGELGLGATNTVISRFRRLTAGELTLNDNDNPSALDIGSYFDAGGAGNDLTIYLQTLDAGEVSFAAASQFVLGGGGFARFTLPADAQTLLNGIASSDRFIFKAARPAAVPTDHAVDAGDAAFAFALPQPTVTHTTALVPTDHAVNAGDAAFVFDLPQPTVTHNTLDTVNAGDASWAFAVPQPTVTHTPRVAVDHTVNAGDAAFAFALYHNPLSTTSRRVSRSYINRGLHITTLCLGERWRLGIPSQAIQFPAWDESAWSWPTLRMETVLSLAHSCFPVCATDWCFRLSIKEQRLGW